MSRTKGQHFRQWTDQVVHIQDPPIDSPAQLVLLTKYLVEHDKSIYSESRMGRIRKRWMKDLMAKAESGQGLTCAICGKGKLFPNSRDPYRLNLATLDHIIDISSNGKWNDPANFQVACYRCNQNKSKKNNFRR